MKPTAVERVRIRLLELIEKIEGSRLPPVAELCKLLHTSPATISRAAHILREQGVLEFYRGKCMDIAGRTTVVAPAPRQSSAERLFQFIKDKIEHGEFAVGTELPKIEYYMRERHISNRSVIAAYNRLEQEMLVHRNGKKWVIGKRLDMHSKHPWSAPPVVVIVQPKPSTWIGLAKGDRTAQFCQRFLAEIQSCGIETQFLSVSNQASSRTTIAEMHDLLRRLAHRYIGALVVGDLDEFAGYRKYLFELVLFKRPVVWFDAYDRPLQQPIRSSNFYRLHFHEKGAIRHAITVLRNAGHRRIGYCLYEDNAWSKARAEMFMEECARFPDTAFYTSSPYRALLKKCDLAVLGKNLRLLYHRRSSFRRIFDQLFDSEPDPAFADEYRSYLQRYSWEPLLAPFLLIAAYSSQEIFPHVSAPDFRINVRIATISPIMIHLLSTPGISALISPNDRLAGTVYSWLKAAEMPVPGSLSLLSFDNYILIQPWPVSTIDFGFGYLGFAAVHLMLDDIQIRHARKKAIPARPFAANRGSIGAPGELPADLPFGPILPIA